MIVFDDGVVQTSMKTFIIVVIVFIMLCVLESLLQLFLSGNTRPYMPYTCD